MTIPTVDIRSASCVDGLRHAFGEIGFAQIVGHEVSASVVADAFEASAAFHALPLEQKLEIELDGNHRGYLPIASSTDRGSELGAASRPNQSASFLAMGEAPVSATGYLAGPNQWPSLEDFRPAVETYSTAVLELARHMLELLIEAFELKPILAAFEEPTVWTRLLHYPATDQSSAFGSAPHTDFGAVTLVAQDDASGLQVQTPMGDWLDVEPQPGAFVMNAGEMLRRWSNGTILATPHRVLSPPDHERFSIACFYDPAMTAIIEPLSGDPEFEPIMFEHYVRSQLEAGYQHHGAD